MSFDLAIDIGNSQITLGLGDDAGWRARWRLASDPRRTADEYAALVRDLVARDGCEPASVRATVVSSVVPALTPVIGAVCRRLFDRTPLVVGPGVHTGMAVRYNPPAALGADRLVNAVAARARFGAPVVVVDFGTATTFNVVDAGGVFVGGAIAPGVGLAAAALAEAGARLHRIDLAPASLDPPPLVGRTTEQSMRSGVLYGYAGLVEGLLARIDAELGVMAERGAGTNRGGTIYSATAPVPVIATGGMAGLVAPLVPRITAVEPDLILDGLRIILALNPAIGGGEQAKPASAQAQMYS